MEKNQTTRLKPVQSIAMDQADYSWAQTYSMFALMNSAPAELLHPLMYAALQPYLTSFFDIRAQINGHVEKVNTASIGRAANKKIPAISPVLENCFGCNYVFQRKRRLT